MAEIKGQNHDRIGQEPDTRYHIEQPPGPTVAYPRREIDSDPTIWQRCLSATVGSLFVTMLVTPLDVVRVRLQSQASPSPTPSSISTFQNLPKDLGITACCRDIFWVQNQAQFECVAGNASAVIDSRAVSDCAAEETQRRSFNTTIDGLRKIARNEGILTLWRGTSPTLLMAVPANVIYFAGYDWLRTSAKSPMQGRVSDTYAPLVGGSVARIIAAMAVSPIEMLRTRMQATSNDGGGVLRSTILGLREMGRTEGYQSLWRGLSLTLWRDVPFSALYWWGYEQGRAHLNTLRKQSAHIPQTADLSHSALLTDSFLAGATSGAIAAFVTTPFDVGKTRQQTLLHDPEALKKKTASVPVKDLPEMRTMPRFLWHIYCSEGMAGLFKGWSARCMKVAPACAIMISSYEVGKKMARGSNERKESGEEV